MLCYLLSRSRCSRHRRSIPATAAALLAAAVCSSTALRIAIAAAAIGSDARCASRPAVTAARSCSSGSLHCVASLADCRASAAASFLAARILSSRPSLLLPLLLVFQRVSL